MLLGVLMELVANTGKDIPSESVEALAGVLADKIESDAQEAFLAALGRVLDEEQGAA